MNPRLEAALKQVPSYDPARSRVAALSGGLTNENFRVDADAGSFVVRLAGARSGELGIRREHELECARIAARLGVAPEVIGVLQGDQGLITRFVDSRAMTDEAARDPAVLKRFVRALRAIHDGPAFPGSFSPFQTVRTYHASALALGVEFPHDIHQILARMETMERALAGKRPARPCHNDLLASNLLDDGGRIWILDWEYAAMGDPFFDLGNFAVNQKLDEGSARALLREYAGHDRDFADLELMMAASDLREAFWGFLQSGLSVLDFDYRGYAMKHLERFCG